MARKKKHTRTPSSWTDENGNFDYKKRNPITGFRVETNRKVIFADDNVNTPTLSKIINKIKIY